MNSDNSALGGVTLDYGPFAFMERFVPMYNPVVADLNGVGVPGTVTRMALMRTALFNMLILTGGT